jgi:hypothetical protein
MVPSLNDGQDNCGCRLGQQPQSMPKITRVRGASRASKGWLVRRVARFGAFRSGQNAQPNEDQRTDADPLSRDVKQIRGDCEPDDENEESEQIRRERGHVAPV